MFTSPFRALTFGEILDGAFALYRRHFLTFFLTALVPYVPASLAGGWFAGSGTDAAEADPVGYMGMMLVVVFVTFAALALIWGALTRQASQAYVGGAVALGDGLRQGVRSLFYVFVAGFFAYLAMGVVMFAVLMVFAVIGAVLIPAAGDNTVLGVVLGAFIVLAVLAVFVAVMALFFAVVPAIVLERRNPFDALARSVSLAWGALPRVAGVLAVITLIWLLPFLGSIFLIYMAEGFSSLATGQVNPVTVVVQQVVSTLVYALTFPFLATSLVLLYFDRRARTEAHDLEGMVQGLAVAG